MREVYSLYSLQYRVRVYCMRIRGRRREHLGCIASSCFVLPDLFCALVIAPLFVTCRSQGACQCCFDMRSCEVSDLNVHVHEVACVLQR